MYENKPSIMERISEADIEEEKINTMFDKLNAEILAILTNPDMQNRLKDLGAQPAWTSPEDYQKLLESDYKKWAEVAKKAKIEGQ
jgi:tripartite-type tricarboxylate transporter receptor subunit TctC